MRERGGGKRMGSGSQEGIEGGAGGDPLRHDSARLALVASLGRAQEETRGSIMDKLIPTAKAMLGEFVEGFSRVGAVFSFCVCVSPRPLRSACYPRLPTGEELAPFTARPHVPF